ncbi:protein of unknown function [Burkholderia multivorans]
MKSRAAGLGSPSGKTGPFGPIVGIAGRSAPGGGKKTLTWSSNDADSKSARSGPDSVTRSRCGVTAWTRTTCSRRNLRGWRTRVTVRSGACCISRFSGLGQYASRVGTAFDLGGRAAQDRRDASLFVGGRVALVQQRMFQRHARFDEFRQPALAFVQCFARERAAHEFHLPGKVRETREQQADAVVLRIEMCAARVGERVALAVAFGLHRDETDFLEIGQRRVDHAGTRAVEALRAGVERLDQFVAVTRLLGEEREQQQLQVVGAELAAARHRFVVAAESAKAAGAAAERPTAAPVLAMAADGLPERTERGVAVLVTVTVATGGAVGVAMSHDRILYIEKHI